MRGLYIKVVGGIGLFMLACMAMLWGGFEYLRSTERRLADRQFWGAELRLVQAELARTPWEEREAELTFLRTHLDVELTLHDAARLPDAIRWSDPERRYGVEGEPREGMRLWAPVYGGRAYLCATPQRRPPPPPLNLSWMVAGMVTALLVSGAALTIPLTRRLERLDAAAQRIQRGDLTVRIDDSGRDAIGALAQSFNAMTAQLQSSFRARDELFQAVTHELGHPLSRLRLGLSLLELAQDASGRRDRARAMEEDLAALEELIEELMRFQEAETLLIHRQPLLLSAGLGQLVEAIREELEFNITAHLPPDLQVEVEPRLFLRAMENLLRNGARYGESHVVVEGQVEGDEVVIEVRDDGPGIPASERARVLEPFARLDASRTQGTGGFGLGLAIVGRIVRQHHGQLTIGEAPEGGAAFITRWPRSGATLRNIAR